MENQIELQATSGERKWNLLVIGSITLLTILAFFPTFTNGFQMEWDDQWMVVNSQTVGRPSKYLLLNIFTAPSHGQIAPVNQLIYTLLYRCFGLVPLPYHVTCLLLHLINIYLLFVGLRMILNDCTKIPATRAKWIVAITTVLFAIHPLQVESVAWISASKIPLSTTFYFAGSIMLIKHLRKTNYWWYAGALLMQLLAYLSKEQAVVFPLFAALLFLWYGIRLKDKRFWFGLIPFGILGLVSLVHEVFYVANYDLYILGDTYVWWQRMIFCVYSVITYFFKWLVPINLNWMYLFPIGMDEDMPWWLILYPILAVVLIYASWNWLKKPLVASLLAFFIIHLLLVIHITVLPRASVVADRYLYISIISLNFMFAYFITGLGKLFKYPKLKIIALSVVITVLVGVSYFRTMDWKDSKTLRSVFAVENSSSVK
jgi:hypothetical protein